MCSSTFRSSSNLDQCLAILRNVPRLSKEDAGPDLCYSVKPFLMNTLWYGLPQNRERVYVVGVKTSGDELGVHPDVYLERVQLYLSKMYVNPPSPDAQLNRLPCDFSSSIIFLCKESH